MTSPPGDVVPLALPTAQVRLWCARVAMVALAGATWGCGTRVGAPAAFQHDQTVTVAPQALVSSDPCARHRERSRLECSSERPPASARGSITEPAAGGGAPSTREDPSRSSPHLANQAPSAVQVPALGLVAPIDRSQFSVTAGHSDSVNACGRVNNPCDNDSFENMATSDGVRDDVAALVPLVQQHLDTGHSVQPGEPVRIVLLAHRNSTRPAVGNGLFHNVDVDPAASGPGLQAGDSIVMDLATRNGGTVELRWRIVTHPVVSVGERAHDSPGWLVSKGFLDGERSGADQYRWAHDLNGLALAQDTPVLRDVVLVLATSHKGNGTEPNLSVGSNATGYLIAVTDEVVVR